MFIPNKEKMDEAIGMGRYAWPGGYPVYFIMKDDGIFCYSCMEKEQKKAFQEDDEFTPSYIDISWENEIHCSNCGEQIETAYGVWDEDAKRRQEISIKARDDKTAHYGLTGGDKDVIYLLDYIDKLVDK